MFGAGMGSCWEEGAQRQGEGSQCRPHQVRATSTSPAAAATAHIPSAGEEPVPGGLKAVSSAGTLPHWPRLLQNYREKGFAGESNFSSRVLCAGLETSSLLQGRKHGVGLCHPSADARAFSVKLQQRGVQRHCTERTGKMLKTSVPRCCWELWT